MFPAIDRRLATFIGILVFILGFVFLPLNKYKSMLFLRKAYPTAAKRLVEAYDNYVLQKENLEKIQDSLDRSIDINSLKSLLPKDVIVRFDTKNHLIYISGSIPPSKVYKLVNLVTTTSNLRFDKLYIKNPIAIPITVFPLDMSNTIDVDCIIEYLEVKQ